MVSTTAAVHEDEPGSTFEPRPVDHGKYTIPVATCVLVAALSQLPVLRDRWFFFTDDSATQILPMWYRLGEMVRAGDWPPLLVLDAWMGGNLAVEALFGVWNPVNAVVWVFVSLLPDLALAGNLIRTVAFVAVAFGCYGLCREYGAARWAASVVAVALPFCGPLFYFDATKWPAALLAFVWIPYLWWAARRLSRDRMNAIWVFLIGALAVTSGNPYAVLGVCVVLVGVLAETLVLRRFQSALRVFLASTTIATVVPLVFLPLLLSRHVTWRTETGVGNSGFLTPGVGDLIDISVPSYVPEIVELGDAAVYFCWFAVPLAVWLDWTVLRTRWRELTGVLFVAGVFVLFAVGPSELWMFRWPLRILHYGYLAIAVLLAFVLSAGLRFDRTRRRTLFTGLIVLFSFYLGWAAAPYPDFALRNLVSLLVIGGLTAAVVLARRYRRSLAVLLQVGTVIAFGLQVLWFMGPHPRMSYYFPTSPRQAQEHFEDRLGQSMQIADPGLVDAPHGGRAAWRDLLPGNLHLPSGVHNINAYSGMGMATFSDHLCFTYHGSTCKGAYATLWRRPPEVDVPLADLLRLDTVVVQRALIPRPRVPEGWAVRERNDRVTVLHRTPPATWHGGRLSWTSSGLRITANATPDDRNERVRFVRSGGSGRMVFARLAWPGYSATVNGVPVPAYAGPAGLLEIQLPRGVDRGELSITWVPPRFKASLALVAVGFAGAVALGVVQRRRRVKLR